MFKKGFQGISRGGKMDKSSGKAPGSGRVDGGKSVASKGAARNKVSAMKVAKPSKGV